ncbi:hypothetical protein GCM10019017_17540 [Streptomyces showdoensis]
MHALVPEVQLQLLEGPLDQEAGEGVHDRPHPGEGEPAARADEQLLADADVEHAVGVPFECLLEAVLADLGEHDREPRVLVEQPAGGGDETITHGVHGRGSPREGGVTGG